jgi:8-amino-7-oxononanoate synthase
MDLEERLLKRKRFGNLRQLPIIRDLIDFSSNDYLGLAKSSNLAASVMQEERVHTDLLNGLGSTGSRLLTGNSIYAQELEDRIAMFHGYEAGLLFNCGYMANVGLLSTIGGFEETIFFDVGVHASTRDGIRLSRAKAFPFRHNDLEHLENRLNNLPTQGARFICVESIYSTDGTQAPLLELCRLARDYGAHVIVDEAHAVGVCGPSGRGLVAAHHLTAHLFAQVVTFGKALGTYGAIVLGSHSLKQALINFATSYIYTTAPPLRLLTAIKCSYDLFPRLEKERSHLNQLIQSVRETYPNSSGTHIQSVAVKGNEAVKCVAERLSQQGFDVRPLMSPTVQRGEEVLRICLHAFNTEGELRALLEYV